MECEHIIINLNKTKQSINSISVNILIEFRSNISSILCDLINDKKTSIYALATNTWSKQKLTFYFTK